MPVAQGSRRKKGMGIRMDKREIAVDMDMMHHGAGQMENALDKMKAEIENLFLEIEEFTGMWDGAAHEEFLKQLWLDKRKMQEFENAAEKLAECMEYARKEYQSCENAVSSIVHTVQI